jgi:hypothetical protein
VLHTINLYQVYEFYIFFNSGGVPADNSLYHRIAGSAKVWSALFVMCFWVYVVLMPFWAAGSRLEDEAVVDVEPASPQMQPKPA